MSDVVAMPLIPAFEKQKQVALPFCREHGEFQDSQSYIIERPYLKNKIIPLPSVKEGHWEPAFTVKLGCVVLGPHRLKL